MRTADIRRKENIHETEKNDLRTGMCALSSGRRRKSGSSACSGKSCAGS